MRPTDSSFLSARQPFSATENAQWYSSIISQRNREKKFMKTMREQFEIESISVEVELGAPSIFIKAKWPAIKIPIGLASDGMTKLLTVLLHIAHAENSATFLDELENGLHFSRHKKFWAQVLAFADDFKSQVFASTHSFEFIEAAVPTMEKHPDDFTIIRVYQKDGRGHAAVLSGKDALSLIEAGLELRG
jgi:AAA15 family ATPase/GTPase